MNNVIIILFVLLFIILFFLVLTIIIGAWACYDNDNNNRALFRCIRHLRSILDIGAARAWHVPAAAAAA